jgi:hypothetical protein
MLYNAIPESLTAETAERYILSIRLWSGGFSFSGYNVADCSAFFYREVSFAQDACTYVESLKSFFFEHECLAYSYKKVYVLVDSLHYALLPAALVAAGSESACLKFNFVQIEGCVLTNQVNEELVNVFDLNASVYEFCSRNFVSPEFVHHLTPVVAYWQKQNLLIAERAMYIYLHEQRIDISCFSGGVLQYTNTFSFQTVQDLLYYILYVWKEVGLDQLVDKLYIQGEVTLKNQLFVKVSDYIQHITQAETPSEVFLWGPDALRAPLDLLTLLITCE